jgi:hypothetical protein
VNHIEAMKQALGALETIADEVFSPYDNELGEVIPSLRQAIEQAEKKHLEEIENVMLEIWQPVAGAWNPINTTPQPQREWVGLTDEETDHLFNMYERSSFGLVRAVEAKLKEKNT